MPGKRKRTVNLVVFDLDGTLTSTNEVDNRCYERTFEQMFGLRVGPDDWHRLTHVTDAGILEGLLLNLRGQGPSAWETAAFKESFFQKLGREFNSNPASFAPVPGALGTIHALRADPQWAMAIATGGWEGSALFKLRCAKIDWEGLPLAGSDDAVARTDIIRRALEQAKRMNSGNGFKRIVSVGDGSWDVSAARELGLAFVGIGSKKKLRGCGALHVRPDLRNAGKFLELLSRVEPPVPV